MYSTLDEKLVANYLSNLIKKNGLSCEIVAQKSNSSESTVRNLCSGKTANPGILTVLPVLYAAGGSPEEMLFGKSKDFAKEISINSVKEIYEQQLLEKDKLHEKHEENIRSHYEQHRKDSIANYEKRLADKREIIEQKEEHIKTLKKEIISSKIFSWVCVAILLALLIAEVMNPNLGWLRF